MTLSFFPPHTNKSQEAFSDSRVSNLWKRIAHPITQTGWKKKKLCGRFLINIINVLASAAAVQYRQLPWNQNCGLSVLKRNGVSVSTLIARISFRINCMMTESVCYWVKKGRWFDINNVFVYVPFLQVGHKAHSKLQALVCDILPSTTAVFSYAVGPRKLSARE